MYKCNCCGHIFSDCGVYKELVGEYWGWGHCAYEEFSCCPRCFDDDFEEYTEDEEANED